MRRLLALLLLAPLACAEPRNDRDDRDDRDDDENTLPDAGDTTEPVEFCDGATTLLYAPTEGDLAAFPDDFWTVDDASSATGLRVRMEDGDNLKVPSTMSRFARVYEDLSTLDGFGVSAPVFFRFSGPVDRASLPDGAGSDDAGGAAVLVDLDSPTPEFVPFETSTTTESGSDASVTVTLTPMRPLQPGRRYAAVITSRALDAQGGCLAPSETMKSLVEGSATDPSLTRLADRHDALIERLLEAGTISDAREISAAVVFTTQTTTDQSAAVAADIRSRSFTWQSAGACTTTADYRLCEGSFQAGDYRTNGYVTGTTPARTYSLPVQIYLPLDPPPATGYPTAIYGHGLSGNRAQAQGLAQGAAPQGIAVVAIDAVKHGAHPDAASNPQLAVLDFFAVSLFGGQFIDARKLRDNFRQSTYDKLQLVQLLEGGIDVDGDSQVDVSTLGLSYAGVSLGGIMSGELLALSPAFHVAVAIVPGARLSEVLVASPQFDQAIGFARGQATDGDLARYFSLLQAVLDRGDPGAYLPHVLRDRLPGLDARSPQFLVQMAIGDAVVSNASTRFFARAAGLPLVGPALQPIPYVPHQPVLPLKGNIRPGLTAGLFQYDLVLTSGGGTAPAAHDTLPGNALSFLQLQAFVEEYRSTGTAEIIDPYVTLGLK